MFNKTVNDASYSSNKNDLHKNSIKEITNHPKESTILNVLGIIFTVLLSTSTILIIFTHNFELSACGAFSLILLLVSAFIINLFFKDCYIRGFTISLSAYICSIAYMDVLNDTIQHIPIIEDFIAILAVTIYFAITCSFIYRSFQLVLKENTKLIFPVIALFVFFAILDNSNWEIVVLAVAVVTFVLEPKNLNILFKKVFHKKIKCGKKTLVVLRICVLLLQVLVYLSMELSKLLGKFVENCAYTCMSDGWLAFFRILIFVVLSTVMMHLLKTKKDKICYLLEKIIDCVDKYCK
ncbi:hypothetical protein HRR14_04785 [Gardnerella vaginalis]|jgi:membrane protein|uniref:hypothetical protein n=1 Tax=Gardnerella vaginalis TaxID=2702 RepID=UPI0002635467|nr:hypothetical protein [Gardnerella vaginalis]EIK77862.1 hypothetical protein CGSMWGv0288E_01663 [Gardnerella vaginalis 0288E]MDK8338285.1 hypothetical protein [Gardnerella vaginalis]NSX24348.1 hypothetical protein [Gardnerella vaginalis]NSX29002.1 hypothetical protein [Gardnerella vaginalis]UQA83129.1 hypothetical protein K9E41_04940 [Gardnerella vaginalis]